MYFSDLRSPGDAPENKQRINLSKHAYDTLIHDASIFLPDEDAVTNSGAIGSGLLNHIVRHFAETAESSIAATLRSRREEYARVLSPMAPGAPRDQALALFLMREKQRLKDAALLRLKERGHAFSFRIDRENVAFLASPEGQAEAPYYQDNAGAYLKAILEEYACLPFVRREQIYCQCHLQTIHAAIDLKKRLKVTLRNSHLATDETMYMKPYALLQDEGQKYNYLVGMLSAGHDGAPFQCASVRLTSIVKCSAMQRSGALRAEEHREIERRIREAGVPYLSSGSHTQMIRVRLSDEGVKMFHSILHLRPMYVSRQLENGTWIYEFDCLPWQAEIYFFKFGEHAVILSPESLAKTCRQKYRKALEAYDP